MTNPFVFIVGCPRSGTTLFRRMVDAHPEIAIIAEIGWLALKDERRKGITADGIVTPTFVEHLPRKGGFGRYTRLPVSREELLAHITAEQPLSYPELITWLFDRYGQAEGKALVGNKTVDNVLSIEPLHHFWPHAKFVHLIRDGRDVALSAISWRRAPKLAERFATWRDDPISTAALWWEWHVRMGREAGSALPANLYYELRYEALVDQPTAECAALCRFLGLPYDGSMVRFHEGRTKQDASLGAKHGWAPPMRGLRDWRSQMPPDDVARFEAVAGELLDELGYQRGAPHISDAQLEHAARLRSLFEGQPLPQHWHTGLSAHNHKD